MTLEERFLMHHYYQYYFKPHPLLTSYIAHYTIEMPTEAELLPKHNKKIEQEERMITILPDASGCIVVTYRDGNVESGYWGPTTRSVIVPQDIDIISLRLFVEFLPGGSRYFKGLEQSRETDEQLMLQDLNRELAGKLEEIVAGKYTIRMMVEKMDEVLLENFAMQPGQVVSLLPYINGKANIVTVKELAEHFYYSPRHINRLFHEELGMNAKTYLRLVRINQCMMQMSRSNIELTNLCQQLGYYDQAHFIHDFKAVCGVSPTVYQKNMSDFYNEPFKF